MRYLELVLILCFIIINYNKNYVLAQDACQGFVPDQEGLGFFQYNKLNPMLFIIYSYFISLSVAKFA